MKVLSLWFSFCLLTSFDDVIVSSLTVTISNNGYHGLLIAINFEVPESSQLIDAIKVVGNKDEIIIKFISANFCFFCSNFRF